MILEPVGGKPYYMCRIPGLVRTERGTLLAYYECRRETSSDWAAIDLKIIRSTDGGNTWETVAILHGDGNTLNNPVMIVEGDTVHFLYCKNYSELFYAKSTDDGRSFSEPVNITQVLRDSGYAHTVAAVGPGHGIVHKGRLLVPIWFAYCPEDTSAHHPSFLSILYSEDHGKTWQVGEPVDMGKVGEGVLSDPNESCLAVTAEGGVMISIRNQTEEEPHMRALAFSENGIEGWSVPYLENRLLDAVCEGSMTHRDGTVFHINCDYPVRRQRKNLTVKITKDAFQTYQSILVDREGGYADLVADGEKLYVIYEKGVFEENGGLYFKVLPYSF